MDIHFWKPVSAIWRQNKSTMVLIHSFIIFSNLFILIEVDQEPIPGTWFWEVGRNQKPENPDKIHPDTGRTWIKLLMLLKMPQYLQSWVKESTFSFNSIILFIRA